MRGRIALVVLSAALYALAFPPWYLWPLAWVALVPFLRAIAGVTPGRAALLGLVWGCTAVWAVASWVAPAISFYYQQPWWFGVAFCVVACQVLWGSQYALFGAWAGWLAARTPAARRPVVLAALWVACELARARLVIGEPWLLLGYSLTDHPLLIQAADVGGVYLLSFVVVFVNATIASFLEGDRPFVRTAAPALVVVALLVAYGSYRLATPPAAERTVTVRVVQGNNPLRTQWRREHYGEGLERYLAMSRTPSRPPPQLLVWPESAVTFFLDEEPEYRAHVARMLHALDSELVVGGPARRTVEDGRTRSFNSAFLLDGGGTVRGRYDKRRLLPFAEYFPLRFLTFLRRHFDAVRDFAPGDTPLFLETRAGHAAVVICFEAIFPELVTARARQGAELLINLSNDVWLAGAGPAQHLQMVVLRAVENRLWVLRATTTGISAAIDPLGRIRTRTEPGTAVTFDASIGPTNVTTIYERVGDAFAFACLAATALVAGALRRRTRSTGTTFHGLPR